MKLQSNQRKALEALTSGATIAQASAIADVTESTIYKWRKDDSNGFMTALNEANERILADTVLTLTVASVRAVQVLIEVADDKDSPASVRVSASKAILDSTIKLTELYSFEQRLSELESRLAS